MKAPAAEHGGRRHLFSQLLVWGQGRQRLRVGNQSNTRVLAGLVRKWAVGVLATCLVFSTASAQVRVVQNSEPRFEFINESVAIPPKIERDQLSAPQVVQAPTTPISTEAQFLLMDYVFAQLGYRRYEWKCDSLNAPSRQAAQRLGFSFEGIFRQAVVYKGRSRDTAWFSIIDSEWPALRAAFAAWLNPDNFDAHGQQRASLTQLRAAA